ncbi:MAG: carbohydrate ABC transporter permease [Bacilli bacterium]|jgi:multiple sugar transport system permease protein|nr:carbohydrate ABC transporter permease [Bacilli bacterium]HHU23863.1 carbohydrate ABC transporter permease [Acholeplasmataceae bacterium]
MKKINKKQLKVMLFGNYHRSGIVNMVFTYCLLIGISFIFLYPLLQMLVKSLMGLEDLIDSTVLWIPTKLTVTNFQKAIATLKFWPSLWDTFLVATIPSLIAVVSSAFIGYGFARHQIPGKSVWMALLLVVFLVPSVLISIPTYLTYQKLGILDSLWSLIYPALTGFGLRQVIFILLFYQFFKAIPHELTESAEIDGATSIQVYIKIAVPMSIPAFLISFLYSFVWYWNETTLTKMYLQTKYTTLPMALIDFKTLYETLYRTENLGLAGASDVFNQGVLFAGTLLSIFPLLIMYFICQKWFIESADRSGITGL